MSRDFFLKSTDNGQQTTDFGYVVTKPVEVTNYAFDKLRRRAFRYIFARFCYHFARKGCRSNP